MAASEGMVPRAAPPSMDTFPLCLSSACNMPPFSSLTFSAIGLKSQACPAATSAATAPQSALLWDASSMFDLAKQPSSSDSPPAIATSTHRDLGGLLMSLPRVGSSSIGHLPRQRRSRHRRAWSQKVVSLCDGMLASLLDSCSASWQHCLS